MEIILAIIKFIGTAFMIVSTIFVVVFVHIFLKNLKIEMARSQGLDQDSINKTSMLVYIEKIGEILYMYDKMTNSFIAQSRTEEELWKNAELRCPDINFILTDPKDAGK